MRAQTLQDADSARTAVVVVGRSLELGREFIRSEID